MSLPLPLNTARIEQAKILSYEGLLRDVKEFEKNFLIQALPAEIKRELPTYIEMIKILEDKVQPQLPDEPPKPETFHHQSSKDLILAWRKRNTSFDVGAIKSKDQLNLLAESFKEVFNDSPQALYYAWDRYRKAKLRNTEKILQRRLEIKGLRRSVQKHSERANVKKITDVAAQLWWKILPPGVEADHEIMEYFRDYATRRHAVTFDFSRIEALLSLKPSHHYIGIDEWDGYVVYLFENTDTAILDCPVYGNAIYILTHDWKTLSRMSKSRILSLGCENVGRIIHSGDWLLRVRYAVEADYKSRNIFQL